MPATLADIRNKVRRLTRTVSQNQMSDVQINTYINDFILYDMPEHLRLFALKTTLTWYTEPNKDTYITTTEQDPDDPLYNFDNLYITTDAPIYINGYEGGYYQDRTQFFRLFPFVNFNQKVGIGDNATTVYSGTLNNVPIMMNNVFFSSIDSNNFGIRIKDVPNIINNNSGFLVDVDTNTNVGFINYLTGQWSITFIIPPGNQQDITSMTVPYQPQRPLGLLYYDDVFTVRPIPDKPYPIQMEVFIRPLPLLENGDVPKLEQWWQYIAYGAAKKLLEDRMDMDTVQMILPEFDKQERLVLRRTLVQKATQRSPTIYQGQLLNGPYWNSNFPGGGR